MNRDKTKWKQEAKCSLKQIHGFQHLEMRLLKSTIQSIYKNKWLKILLTNF